MDSQLNQNIITPSLHLPAESESTGVLNSTAARPETSRTNKTSNADEVIASLQNHCENRRARQVFEWETVRRASFGYLRGRA